MGEELRKAAQDAIDFLTKLPVRMQDVRRASNLVIDLRVALAKNANAAPQDATDWEGVAADQAMTIAMLRVDYQQLQALVTSQGVRMMEQEEWQKDAERYRFMRGNESIKFWSRLGELKPIEWDEFIDAAMEQKP